MNRRNLIILTVALAILGSAVVLSWNGEFAGRSPPASDIGGPFHLTAQNGARVDQSILKGKWSAIYFGYTFCPDVCPTTLAALAQAQVALGAKAKAFQVVFITVDPARDTPAQLRAYLSSSSFPKGTIGLTGSAADIKTVAAAYRVYFSPHGSGPDYSVDHTSIVYLMDPEDRFVRPVTSGSPADMAGQIAAAMDGR
ncbi:MAG TPA: SCO family protein [Caulobacteraceae bacterium]